MMELIVTPDEAHLNSNMDRIQWKHILRLDGYVDI